ncbi:MAG: sigma 54-interacting transcriptional regulator, partial [Gammaproteobacteria bacterium]|nr:sigma 54-interacting transcriptional regulator [Gammaproteobacteria bacterium]
QLRFEQLLLEILTQFIDLDLAQINESIPVALARISRFLGSELTTFLQLDPSSGMLKHTHQWIAPNLDFDMDFTSEEFELQGAVPWLTRELSNGEPIIISRLDDFPPEATKEISIFQSTGIKSVVWVPVPAAGNVAACIVLNTLSYEQTWSNVLVQRLQLLGQIFNGALVRGESDRLLIAQYAFESLVSEITARFVNIASDRVDGAIEEALGAIAQYCNADSVTVARLDSAGRLEIGHSYNSDSEQVPDGCQITGYYALPNLAAYLSHEQTFRFDSAHQLPNWPEERGFVKAANSHAALVIRLGISEEWIDAIIISSVSEDFIGPENRTVEQLRLVGRVFLDAVRRQYAEGTLENQLRLEQLLSKLSTTFIALPAEQIDDTINSALRDVGEVMAADRVFVNQFSEGNSEFRVTHIWTASGIPRDDFAFKMVLSEHFPWYTNRMLRGQTLVFSSIDELPEEAVNEREYVKRTGIQSSAIVPLQIDGSVIGNLGLDMIRHGRAWSENLLAGLRLASEIVGNALKRTRFEQQLVSAHQEISTLKERLEAENVYLKKEVERDYSIEGILGHSDAIKEVLKLVEQVAGTEATVLISGETGTGKELIAQAIHTQSQHKGQTLVKVNCAALPATLIEAELFGREKGAYTGALSRQIGRFELADGSTIFLDEISELPLDLQAKLLRVLQDGEFERLGSNKTIKADVRVIAATNQDLVKAVNEGRFREDLYFRLNVFPITVPPLRERRGDIPVLVWAFVEEFGDKMGKKVEQINKSTMESFSSYAWPGNVRELRNIIERAMILNRDHDLRTDLPLASNTAVSDEQTLERVEKQHIEAMLQRTGWRVSGKRGAAQLLGLKPTTLRSKMEKLGIKRP